MGHFMITGQIQLNPPRGKPRGIFTARMKIYFQFAR
jgi:hypothetical protein